MKPAFFCAKQQTETKNTPEKVLACWQDAFHTGLRLCEQKRWQEALPYLCCALETAEILMADDGVKPGRAHELFSSAASMLIDTLGNLGSEDRRRQVYYAAVKVLTRELPLHPGEQVCLGEHLESLYRQLRHSNLATRQPDLGIAFAHHHIRRTTAH